MRASLSRDSVAAVGGLRWHLAGVLLPKLLLRRSMVFQLGRNRDIADRPLEEETLKRWRAAAQQGSEAAQTKTIEWEVSEQSTVPAVTAPEVNEPVQTPTPAFVRPSDTIPRAAASDPKLSVEEDLVRRFGNRVRAALGPGAVIQGKLSFDSPVRIDGTLVGEVTASSTLIVGDQGAVEARIQVGSLIVLGQVVGNVDCEDLVEIKAGGKLIGDIKTRRLVVEENGFFQGKSTPVRESSAQTQLNFTTAKDDARS